MQTVRQMASGIVYAVVSLLLVIGAVALSLAQGRSPGSPGFTQSPVPVSSRTAVPTGPSSGASPSSAATRTETAPPAPTRTSEAAATLAAPTSTYAYPSQGVTVRATSTRAVACGPYRGWVRGYIVQPGDTLYRIALKHGVTVAQLQRANCLTDTLIFAGERLWVPFMLPPATELTIIPTFPTPTEPAGSNTTPEPTSTATQAVDP